MNDGTELLNGVDFITVPTKDYDQTFFRDPDGNALAIHHRYAPKDATP